MDCGCWGAILGGAVPFCQFMTSLGKRDPGPPPTPNLPAQAHTDGLRDVEGAHGGEDGGGTAAAQGLHQQSGQHARPEPCGPCDQRARGEGGILVSGRRHAQEKIFKFI